MAEKKFDISKQLGFNLHRLAVLYRRRLVQTFQEYNLTPEQWQILNALWRQEHLTTSSIAEFTLQDLPSALRSLQRLQEKNYVIKFSDLKDKRTQNWKISPEGKKLEGILPKQLLDSFESYLSGYPKSKLDELNKGIVELLGFLEGKG
jgi:MarR family transcriptional regulator, lower aerobic nicotinate degradation pathway regulator